VLLVLSLAVALPTSAPAPPPIAPATRATAANRASGRPAFLRRCGEESPAGERGRTGAAAGSRSPTIRRRRRPPSHREPRRTVRVRVPAAAGSADCSGPRPAADGRACCALALRAVVGGAAVAAAVRTARSCGHATLDPFGAAPDETAGDGGDGSSASGFPPPPPYDPAPPAGDSSPHRRRKAGRPLALFAAVALVAGAIGGGAGALGRQRHREHSTSSTATPATWSTPPRSTVRCPVAKADSPTVVEITATSSVGEAVGSGVHPDQQRPGHHQQPRRHGATSIKVTYSDGKTASATIVGTDTAKDLALIQITGASA